MSNPLSMGKGYVWRRIKYTSLNARQKENYNFHKLAALLADYGFSSIWLSDDWQGADLLAVHIDGATTLRIQLKGRCAFHKKYLKKGIYIAFPVSDRWCVFPHDEVLNEVIALGMMVHSDSWSIRGSYSFSRISSRLGDVLEPYMI